MAITSRPYAGEADYAAMRSLLVEIYNRGGPPVYCTVGDLDWWRCTADNSQGVQQAQLWLDPTGTVVGFTWPSGVQVDLMVHPDYRALEDDMLAWAEERRRAQASAADGKLQAWGYTDDAARNEVLQHRGYRRTNDFFTYLRYDLSRSLPEPYLPQGYTLRHVQGEADVEQRVAVHRDAFAPSRMTVAKHRVVMHAPTYRPELDLVAVAPDGSFAAFCIVWFDEINRFGVFEPVGCHSAHHRRGLSTALIHEGMRRLQALGAQTAFVNGWGAHSAGTLLYKSIGFHEVDRNYAWEKLL